MPSLAFLIQYVVFPAGQQPTGLATVSLSLSVRSSRSGPASAGTKPVLFEWMNRQGRGVPGPSSGPKAPSSDLMLVVKPVAMSS